jgi:hypothetical protein
MRIRSTRIGCPDHLRTEALSRREVLKVGSLGMIGLSLPELFAAEARASNYGGGTPRARARSCILLFISGGPSQHETFDPKPEAPSENKTIFGTIPTKVPGIQLCEYLADLAPLADRFALVRSVWHKCGGHFGGHRYALTGHIAPGNIDQAALPDDKPGIISLASKFLPGRDSFPPAIMLPWLATDQGNGASGGMGPGTLGKQYQPLLVEVDQSSLGKSDKSKSDAQAASKMPVFRVPELTLQAGITPERFGNRQGLLEQIERQRRELVASSSTDEMDNLYRKAYDLLLSPKIKEGFDLDQEDAALRERYGANAFGQSCLMARRLVERGARFVQVNFSRYVTHPGYGWDTHDKGRDKMKDELLPKLNAGLAGLIADLDQRGLLKDTLVVAMGEFGRTPRVKPDGGRDHWPQCYSLLMAGGGVHGGLVHGRSDKIAAYPASDPVEAREIIMTILTLLGVPTFLRDIQGREAPLFEGVEPVKRLYS